MFKWFFNLFRKKKVALKVDNTPLYYKIAVNEIGVNEVLGVGNNPRILEYHDATSLDASQDSVPWCSSYINWVLKQAGIKGTNSAAARSFLSWGKPVSVPVKGDIVIFWRGTPDSASGHVAFYVEESDQWLTVLGGNQLDSVCYQKYKKDRVLGYRRLIKE